MTQTLPKVVVLTYIHVVTCIVFHLSDWVKVEEVGLMRWNLWCCCMFPRGSIQQWNRAGKAYSTRSSSVGAHALNRSRCAFCKKSVSAQGCATVKSLVL